MKIGNQTYTLNEDASWSHVSEESSILLKAESPKKKNGNLKAKYKDLPRYKLIPIYEDHFKKEFNSTIVDITKDVFKFLKENIK
jgi:hypothetical protein